MDGMNIVGSRPTGWWRDRPGAMRELVESLEGLAARSGDAVTVVFDGSPFELEAEGGVEVLFASRRGGMPPTTTSPRSWSATTTRPASQS